MKIITVRAPSNHTLPPMHETMLSPSLGYSSSSRLMAPQDTGIRERIMNFLNWIWEKLSFLFCGWWANKKEEPPQPLPAGQSIPPEDFLRAYQLAKARAMANQSQIPGILFGAAISGVFSLLFRSNQPILTYIATQAVAASAYSLEKIAARAFRQLPTHYNKAGSLTISAVSVWMISRSLGHELGYLYLIGTGFRAYQIVAQASASSRQQNLMRLRHL